MEHTGMDASRMFGDANPARSDIVSLRGTMRNVGAGHHSRIAACRWLQKNGSACDRAEAGRILARLEPRGRANG